jgi:H+-translocating NAD(P) transhydrogenase subunit alpha
MKLGILKESLPEKRVAILPETCLALKKLGVQVAVEKKAGTDAFASDSEYEAAGCKLMERHELIAECEVLVGIRGFEESEIGQVQEKKVLLALVNPFVRIAFVKKLAEQGLTVFSMEIIPRTTRAQAMDILSSMATVSGYKAVLDAAFNLPRFFPMFMTAAGTIKPARVLILGAGVAGLQAVATARKLGAIVEVFDVRSAVKEEVLSLGAKFIEVAGAREDATAGGYAVEQSDEFRNAQAKAIHDHAAKADVVICTAQIPGKPAPLLIHRGTVEAMRAGSVIIDLAASSGGNCEITRNGETFMHNQVSIIGRSDYPSFTPTDASKMFGTNLLNFLKLIISDKGELVLDFKDDIVKGTCITHAGEIVNDRLKSLMNQ